MITDVAHVKACEVIYFNCVECGAPIFDEVLRRRGLCGCLDGKTKGKVMSPKHIYFDDLYDPYGQPIAESEAK